MQGNAVKAKYDTLRVLGNASIAAGYTAVGGVLTNPIRILKVNNTTDANVIISFARASGLAVDMDFCAAESAFVYDFAANQSISGGNLEQAAGDFIFVKRESAAPTLGNFYVTIIYASV